MIERIGLFIVATLFLAGCGGGGGGGSNSSGIDAGLQR